MSERGEVEVGVGGREAGGGGSARKKKPRGVSDGVGQRTPEPPASPERARAGSQGRKGAPTPPPPGRGAGRRAPKVGEPRPGVGGAGGGPRAEPPPSGGARPGAAGRAALRWRRRPPGPPTRPAGRPPKLEPWLPAPTRSFRSVPSGETEARVQYHKHRPREKSKETNKYLVMQDGKSLGGEGGRSVVGNGLSEDGGLRPKDREDAALTSWRGRGSSRCKGPGEGRKWGQSQVLPHSGPDSL